MCIDLQIPDSSSSVAKRHSLNDRILDVLTPFDLQFPKHFDDKEGLSQEEFDKIRECQAARITMREGKEIHQAENNKYGGSINNRPHRKIKTNRSKK